MRIAAVPSAAMRLLPDAVERLRRLRPGEPLAPSVTAHLAETRFVATAFSQTLPFDGTAESVTNSVRN